MSTRAQNIENHATNYLTNFRQSPKYNFKYGDVKLDRKSLHHWQRILKREASHFTQNYDDVKGDKKLRQSIATHLRLNRGVLCDAHQIIITNGSQQALNVVARCFINNGDTVITEDPCYLGSTLAFTSANANLTRIRVDNNGLNINRYVGKAPKLIYLTPSHQYPTGIVMSAKRRLDIIEWANKQDCLIIEDDYDSEFRYEGQPITSIHNLDKYNRTIYIGTFSKSLYPALRIGYLVIPEDLVDAITAWKWNEDRHCSSFVQPALAEFIAQGHYARHIKRMRNLYAEKRLHLMHSLETYLGDHQYNSASPAGLHLLTWLPSIKAKQLDTLLQLGLNHNLGLYPVNQLYQCPPGHAGLVMGFTPLTTQEIEIGVKLLAKIVQEMTHH